MRAAENLVETGAIVMRFRLYNTPAEGQPCTLDVDKSRAAIGSPLIDTAHAQARANVAQSFPTRAATRGPDREGTGR